MNATQLLAHFDRLAEAPDAVPRLRRFILDLAVRGKLVEQDAGDEPAATLRKRIDKEKSKLVARGEVRQERARVPIDPEEMTFKLPLGWEWTRFGDYASDIATGPFGSALHQSDYVFNGIPLVNPSHMQNGQIVPDPKVTVSEETAKSLTVYRMRVGDIVMARRGEVGRAAIVTQRESGWLCGTGSFYLRFAADVNRDYVILLLLCDSVRRYLAGEAVGTTMVNLNHSILKRMPLAIPPLAEQRRIVAKVDELMDLCDQLEAAQQERERRRDHLAGASLQRLNQPGKAYPATDQTEPAEARQQAQREQQKDHARFHLQNLNRLTTRPEHVKAMRQIVLRLAVSGRLVAHDPNDESAAELLRRIEAEKLSLIKLGKLRKDKPPTLISAAEKPFDLPNNWKWVRTQAAYDVRDGTHDTPRYVQTNGIPLITSRNFDDGEISFEDAKLISRDDHEAIKKRSAVDKGDILYSMIGGNIGNQVLVNTDREFSIKNVALFKCYSQTMSPPAYLNLFLKTVTLRLQEDASGGAQPFVSLSSLRNIPVPIPPLAEQHRIVAKVDELMALCDQLEAQLTQSQTDSRRLLEAVLDAAIA